MEAADLAGYAWVHGPVRFNGVISQVEAATSRVDHVRLPLPIQSLVGMPSQRKPIRVVSLAEF